MKKSFVYAKNNYVKRVPAADQAIRILFCLADNAPQRLRLTDICEQLGINKSKGYSLLNTLSHHGLVKKDPYSKHYSLGLALLFLSRKLLDNLEFKDLTSPHLDGLAKKTGATALFYVFRDLHAYVAAKRDATESIGVGIRVGHVFPATHGAHGLAMAAFLSDDELDALLKQSDLYFLGPPSVTAAGLDRVRKELKQCRRQGYAKDPGRLQSGLNAVGAPVFYPPGKVFGCVVVVGTFSSDKMDGHGLLAAEAAKQISRDMGVSSA